MRIKLFEIELSKRIRSIKNVYGYDGIRILVRYHGKPLGWIYLDELNHPAVSLHRLKKAISEQIGWILIPEVFGNLVVPKAKNSCCFPPISVVVCTRNRTQQLKFCLDALSQLDYPTYETIVVDNASSDDLTLRLAANYNVRYVKENCPGLDWARNRGITEAKYKIIAFTDDDTRADRLWLKGFATAFSNPEVMAVTGLIAPMELETTAQNYFELMYGGMGKGFKQWIVRPNELDTKQLLWASSFGAGANMAFRRELFSKIGLFDRALDVGTPSRGGGDIELFHRVLANGHTLIYEPSALVWHKHRRDFDSLRRQLYDNGCGFGSYLFTCLRNRTVSKLSLLRFAFHNWLGWWILRRLWKPEGHSRRLVIAELRGALHSPLAYLKTQKQAQKIATLKADQTISSDAIKLKNLSKANYPVSLEI